MILKKFLSITSLLSIISIPSFGIDQNIKNLGNINLKDKRYDVSKFESLNKVNNFNIADYEQLQKINFIDQLRLAEKNFKGNNYISKEEMTQITNTISEVTKNANTPQDFILILTSETVPNKIIINNLLSVGILQSNGIDIETKIYFQGIPEDMETYMKTLTKEIDNYNEEAKELISENVKVKIDPRFFQIFDLKKAPALVFASCPSQVPDVKKCEYKYLIRGDSGLINFFDKIRNIDNKYEKYYRYLIANKIVERG